MKLIPSCIALVIVGILCNQTAQACMWDYDTLAMEKRKFPEALDLITGKFLRHSPDYYKWRIKHRNTALKSDPSNLSLYDDLAVAYDKINQSEKAIEIILKKAELKPGLYETEANLGTFYIHSGQFEKGLEHIKKAIKINPDAHFGREVYQMRLVEYVLSKRVDNKLSLPMDKDESPFRSPGFSEYVLVKAEVKNDSKKREAELAKAQKGVLGMMRFGHHDSPVLLEALGDILLGKGDAKRLAARAYLKASYESKDNAVKKAYRNKASSALSMQTRHRGTTDELTLKELEGTFKKELKEAEKWYAQIIADEKHWKAKGMNLDDGFKAKYYMRSRFKAKAK